MPVAPPRPRRRSYWTRTVPAIPACIVQWYAYVAGAVGITTERVPALKSVAPVIVADENVTLWAMPSLLVKWTVAPGETWIALGLKDRLWSKTSVVITGFGGGLVTPPESDDPPQPTSASAAARESRA